MPSKESPATNAWASSDPEEYDSDSYGLLGHKQTIDKYKQQKKRQWAFLAVNIFVLLLNLGLLLMISVPRTATVAEYTPGVRLPHTG